MAETLYIRLGETEAQWLDAVDDRQVTGRGPLEGIAAQGAAHRVVVLAPAADVLLTRAVLPTQNRQRLRQAAPFAVEEQLSEDVERLHFALGAQRARDGAWPVAAVAHTRMKDWLARLDAAGLHPNQMVPEVLAVPMVSGSWTLLLDGHAALLRTGEGLGHGLDAESAPMLLGLALAEAGDARPALLTIYDFRRDGLAESAARAASEAGVETAIESREGGDVLAIMARTLASSAPMDLLQGEYSRREQIGKLWRPWRPAAAMLAVVVLMQGAMAGYDYVRLKAESEDLSQRIEQVYRSTFPAAKNVVNPRVQMERNLAALKSGGQGGLVPLLVKAAPVLDAAAGLEMTGLRYKDGVLDVDLTLADLQSLDALKQSLTGKGLGVDIQTAGARAGKVEGRLQIRETL